jgi:hypothetical protein
MLSLTELVSLANGGNRAVTEEVSRSCAVLGFIRRPTISRVLPSRASNSRRGWSILGNYLQAMQGFAPLHRALIVQSRHERARPH